ncbi:class I SAM-dependent methyltransferase [Heyndrickxia sp. FSL K6-6286]|uniref:class I SAM-dependent methyltransferase n=1 Tax=Heyndrickxia TaxID=2837504 RepID=UPI0003AB34B0|nr:class I SAM-dependent methyltransferase [Heyndrickxia oleronia]MBU5212639.1 methyltransferase domain-containing protein [Heyndrickxia oleronia]OJH17332.1 16S rRNA (cytosine(1402)-N(4))-methyltransferase [Bacillus obstructivus]
MKLMKVIDFAHSLLKESVTKKEIVVDATVGNGYDTEFLANLVGPEGRVFGFDIQKMAIEQAKRYLAEKTCTENIVLINKGHETLKDSIPEQYHGQVAGAIFNLGYLPGGDKQIITHGNTTINALKQLLEIMKPGALIVLVIYHGHPGGEIERDQVLNFVQTIDQKKAHVLQYQFINQINQPPFVIAIEKR